MEVFEVKSEESWPDFARRFLKQVKAGDRIALHGELGAGKTSFVRACLKELGWDSNVPSPSYPIILEYDLAAYKVAHVDAFRLMPDQSFPADLENWKTAVVFVEWPERTNLAPYSHEIWIKTSANGGRECQWKQR